jgi:hypothetical protein
MSPPTEPNTLHTRIGNPHRPFQGPVFKFKYLPPTLPTYLTIDNSTAEQFNLYSQSYGASKSLLFVNSCAFESGSKSCWLPLFHVQWMRVYADTTAVVVTVYAGMLGPSLLITVTSELCQHGTDF